MGNKLMFKSYVTRNQGCEYGRFSRVGSGFSGRSYPCYFSDPDSGQLLTDPQPCRVPMLQKKFRVNKVEIRSNLDKFFFLTAGSGFLKFGSGSATLLETPS